MKTSGGISSMQSSYSVEKKQKRGKSIVSAWVEIQGDIGKTIDN